MSDRISGEFAYLEGESWERDLRRRRRQLLSNLVATTELAADLMRRSLSGESVFNNNDERQAALALIKLFPAIDDHI